MSGVIFIGVLLLTASVGLLAFAHVTASALRIIAAANGVEQLQIEAALDAASLATRAELPQYAAPPQPESLTPFLFEDVSVSRVISWRIQDSVLQATVEFTAHRVARFVTYVVSAGEAAFLSYQ